jgi:outer membrane biosynthesis protein TonB
MVRLASILARQGDIGSARQTYLKTGLNAQQCALVDVQPAMRRAGVGSSDYPVDAMIWGMGGWTQIEFDVQPDGRTINRRAVMSYPPFLFGESTVKAMEATRYTQTYRPDGAIGCSGAKQRFRYMIPQH